MESQKKEFTGVWIPRHIIDDEDLTMTERIIYAEIACFIECYKSNEELGSRYKLKADTISGVVAKLIAKGYVVSLGVSGGRYRKLRALKDEPNPTQGRKKILGTLGEKSYPPSEKNPTIDNTLDNTKEKPAAGGAASASFYRKDIPIDDDGNPVREHAKKKEVPPLAKELIGILRDVQGIQALDGGNNLKHAGIVLEKFREELDRLDFGSSDDRVREEFRNLLETVQQADKFHANNMTSMRYINNNFAKFIKIALSYDPSKAR